jgi:hypothetical protein
MIWLGIDFFHQKTKNMLFTENDPNPDARSAEANENWTYVFSSI